MRLIVLALRNLTRNRRRTLLSLVTIAAGVGAIICLTGFVAGFLKIMVESQVRSKLGDLQISSKGDDFLRRNDLKLKDLTSIAGVDSATPRLHFITRAKRDGIEVPIIGIGIVPSSENQVCPQAASAIESGGENLQDNDEYLVLLSSDMIENLGFDTKPGTPSNQVVGSELHLATMLPSKDSVVRIKGIQRSIFAFDSRGFLVMSLAIAQNISGQSSNISEIAVRIADGYDPAEVKGKIIANLGEGYRVKDWRETQPFLSEAVGRSQVVLRAICFVLLIIVAFGIANTMHMNVHERTREVGTLAAVGFSAGRIAVLFLVEAFVLGVIGSILGLVLGSALIFLFRKIGIELPNLAVIGVKILRPEWPVASVVPALAAAMVSSLLAGIVPAVHAARLNPIDALRTT